MTIVQSVLSIIIILNLNSSFVLSLHASLTSCDNDSSGNNWSQFIRTSLSFDRKTQNNKFTLTHWFGRLGNNFRQIKTALRYAICCNGRLDIKNSHNDLPHLQRLLDFSTYNNNNKQYKQPRECGRNFNSDFFEPIHRFPVPVCVFDEFSAVQFFVFGNNFSANPSCHSVHGHCDRSYLTNDTLVVHLRSGDVFSPGGVILIDNYLIIIITITITGTRELQATTRIFLPICVSTTSLESSSVCN